MGSLSVSTHVPEQAVVSPSQSGAQLPAAHTSSASQAVSQPPQCWGSALVSTQLSPQSMGVSAGQVTALSSPVELLSPSLPEASSAIPVVVSGLPPLSEEVDSAALELELELEPEPPSEAGASSPQEIASAAPTKKTTCGLLAVLRDKTASPRPS